MILNEDSILELVHRYFPNQNPKFSLARGDDCAVFSSAYPLAISTDLFVEDVHFRPAYFSAEDIGHKALAVNLSDLAAMGAKPLAFSIALCLPKAYANEFFLVPNLQAMSRLAQKYDIFLAGGDLSSGEKLSYCLTVWGEQQEAILKRAQVLEHDIVFVVGSFGLARAGLTVLEKNLSNKTYSANSLESLKAQYPRAISQHLQPDPQCFAGIILAQAVAEQNLRLALMDLSDGLLRDIPRLIASKQNPSLAVNLDFNPNELEPEILNLCTRLGLNPLLFALEGGEDYALLGACDASTYAILAKLVPSQAIGQVISKANFKKFEHLEDKPLEHSASAVYYKGWALNKQGFDHFV